MTDKIKKNILHLCLSLSEGGLEKYAVKLSEAFSKDGFQSYLLCRPGSFIEKKVKAMGLKYFTTNGRDYYSRRNIRQIRKIIEEQNIDIVFVHRLKDLWLSYWVKKKFPHVKIIGVAQTFEESQQKGFLYRKVYRQVDQMVTLTDLQKEYLLKMLPLPLERYVVIPEGVDIEKFSPQKEHELERIQVRKSLNVNEGDILVGLVGRFNKQKGQVELIEAVKTLKEKLPKVKYVFVGADTFSEETIQKMILKEIVLNGLEDVVQVRGYTDNVSALMKALDIFIMPSYKEDFGTALIEAMACEKICISTNAGGPVEILGQGDYGLLIEPKSSQAIEAGIQEVIQNINEYEKKAKLARKRVQQKYRLQDVFEKIKELTYMM